jgi:RNA polymerase sigma factor (sigma-70 family)
MLKTGNQPLTDAQRKVVTDNMGLVHRLVRMFLAQRPHLQHMREDLVQEGTMGLIRAAQDYQESRGCAFSTYAWDWIRKALHEGHKRAAYVVSFPANIKPAAYPVDMDDAPWLQDQAPLADAREPELHARARAYLARKHSLYHHRSDAARRHRPALGPAQAADMYLAFKFADVLPKYTAGHTSHQTRNAHMKRLDRWFQQFVDNERSTHEAA